MIPQVVRIEQSRDLRPFDQIEEGVFIRELRGWRGNPDWGSWEVAPLCWEPEEGPNGETYKRPVWGEPIDRPMSFPLTIVRGVEPPQCPRPHP